MKTRLIEEVTEEDLAPVRENMFAVLNAFPQEAEYVQRMLVEGKIDAWTYNPNRECSCLFGTIGRAKGWMEYQASRLSYEFEDVEAEEMGSAEALFTDIFPGDTPATNKSAAIAFILIEEWLSR
jgi:hypothetical protein